MYDAQKITDRINATDKAATLRGVWGGFQWTAGSYASRTLSREEAGQVAARLGLAGSFEQMADLAVEHCGIN